MHWIEPESLPETSGTLDRVLTNPHGEPDGFILADGTEVHIPPHMGRLGIEVLRPGTVVRVRGVRPRGVAMIAAVAVETEAGGRLVDMGPPDDDSEREEAKHKAKAARLTMTIEGVVRQALHGPKGEVRGVLFEDGRTGRFPPHAAVELLPLLVPGGSLALRGDGLTTPHGIVLAVSEAGRDAASMTPLAAKPKPSHGEHPKDHKPKAPKHEERAVHTA